MAPVQVTLDLGKGPQATPPGRDVADVHADLVCTNPLANQTSPTKGEKEGERGGSGEREGGRGMGRSREGKGERMGRGEGQRMGRGESQEKGMERG